MRKRAPFLFGLTLIVILVSMAPAQQVVDEIVAVVNDDIITMSEVREKYEQTVQEMRARFKDEELTKEIDFLKKDILEMMIFDLLVMQKAKEMNLNVSKEVKAQIDEVKKNNNLESDDDLKRALQEQGMDFNQYVKQIEETILKQAVIGQEIRPYMVTDDSEVISYYKAHPELYTEPEEYKPRIIYLASEGKSAAALEEKRKEILAKLQAGESFQTLAKEQSDPPAKDTEGDLGKFKKGELDKPLELAISKIKVNEMTGWIETRNGWYLMKLEEKKESRLMSFEEARKAVEDRILGDKQTKRLELFRKEIREKSYVKILKPNPLGAL